LSDVAKPPETIVAAPAVSLPGVRSRARTWAPVALIVGVFIAISTFYNYRVPLYEAPDELAHATYMRVIADEGRLPRFETIAEYESWQPPLYYVVGAATLTILGLDSPQELAWNPNFPSERQNYIHTEKEDFPYSGPVLSVHVLRGVGVLFGAGTIVMIYLASLVIFPQRRLLAFASAATVAFIPQFAYISATVSNDPPSFFFAAAIVYLGLRSFRDPSPGLVLLAAIAIGLGALTKLSTLVVAVVPIAAVTMQSIGWREKIVRLAVLGLLPLAMAGWFYGRSLVIWGAVFPEHLFWPQNPVPLWDPAYRENFLEPLSQSFWFTGGPANIHISPIIYHVLDTVLVLALAGVIVTFVSSRLDGFQRRALLLLSALPLLAVGMVLYHSVAHDFQAQGRFLFVAMPAFAILMPLGLSALFSRQLERDHPAMLGLPLLLLAVNVSVFAITLPRHY
jgi:Dolichyl-phosphate-mannose-protein mannosyltransferase